VRARGRGLCEARDSVEQHLALGRLQRRLERLGHQVEPAFGVALRERLARLARELEVEPEQRLAQHLHLVHDALLRERFEDRAARLDVAAAVGLLQRLAVADVRALGQVAQRALRRLGRIRPALAALDEGRRDRGRVPRVVDVVGLLAVEVEHEVARRDALAVEVLLVELALGLDVLAAGHGAKARALDALALRVVVARRVP
jgi:hypothetical protein